MKINEPVTQKQIKIPDHLVLISTTDEKGIITSANDAFVDISGFSRDELINTNHNIVRHPDMPPAAFKDLWDNLKNNKPWIGIVKNRAKNGDHYWVKVYIAPTIVNGELTGYQSVRVQASEEEINRANVIYKKISRGKKRRSKPLTISQKLFFMMFSGIFMVASGYALSVYMDNPLYTGIGLLTGALAAFFIARSITTPIKRAGTKAKGIIHNPLSQEIITGRVGIFGNILLAMDLQEAKLRTFIYRAAYTSDKLDATALETAQSFNQTMDNITHQKNEIDSVATAIDEMSRSIEEVTSNTEDAAHSAKTAKTEVLNINEEISETIGIITNLEQDMNKSVEVIHNLAENSQHIGAVLDVIQGIAEQTNLLALNAAIEAARAGDAGRGFAVVADEVRTLATRTAESTHEIEKIINEIQQSANAAVTAMDIAKSRAELSFEHIENSAEGIAKITTSVEQIENMSSKIAVAAEQQNSVSHNINNNIHSISDKVTSTVSAAEKSVERTQLFSELSKELQTLINQSR